jgi:hypothetical protein
VAQRPAEAGQTPLKEEFTTEAQRRQKKNHETTKDERTKEENELQKDIGLPRCVLLSLFLFPFSSFRLSWFRDSSSVLVFSVLLW